MKNLLFYVSMNLLFYVILMSELKDFPYSSSNPLNQAKGSSPFIVFYTMVNQQLHVNELKIIVTWLYIIFSENKVTKLLIRKIFFSKYRFRQDTNLNECELK